MIAASREGETLGGSLQQAARLRTHFSIGVEPTATGERVAGDRLHFCEALPLQAARMLDPSTNRSRIIAGVCATQLAQGDSADRDVHVDAIGQRTRDASRISIDVSARAGARTRRIACAPAPTRIGGADQREAGGICHRLAGAGDDDLRVFERLSQPIQNVARKLQQLVEKQYTVMGKTYFARSWC